MWVFYAILSVVSARDDAGIEVDPMGHLETARRSIVRKDVDDSPVSLAQEDVAVDEFASANATMAMQSDESSFCRNFHELGLFQNTEDKRRTRSDGLVYVMREPLEAIFKEVDGQRSRALFRPKCETEGKGKAKTFKLSIDFTTPKEEKLVGTLSTGVLTRDQMKEGLMTSEKGPSTTGYLMFGERRKKYGVFYMDLTYGAERMTPLLRPRDWTLDEDIYKNPIWLNRLCTDKYRIEHDTDIHTNLNGLWLYRERSCKEITINRAPSFKAGQIWNLMMQPNWLYWNTLQKYRAFKLGDASKELDEIEAELLDEEGIPPRGKDHLPGMPGIIPVPEGKPPFGGWVVKFEELWAHMTTNWEIKDEDYPAGADQPSVLATLKNKFFFWLEDDVAWNAMIAEGTEIGSIHYTQSLRKEYADEVFNSYFPILSFKRGGRTVDGKEYGGTFGHEEPPTLYHVPDELLKLRQKVASRVKSLT